MDKKRHVRNPLAAAAGSAMLNDAQAPGSFEAQIYHDAWGPGDNDNDSGEDDALAKVDRGLAMEVNIPLDHKGELVSFREVRMWKEPTQADLGKLKTRVNDEWIKPLNLKQQDIVKASGLGAPYVCYLLKDPNSPNMNRRRKIEAYSVLTELFRKYDAKIVTKQDFIRLRDLRVANRFQGPRQDRSGRGQSANGRAQQRRRRRRPEDYDGDDQDDDGSQDEDLNDPTSRMRRKRQKLFGGGTLGAYYPESMMYGMNKAPVPFYPHPMMPHMTPMPGYGVPTPYASAAGNYLPIGPWFQPDPFVARGGRVDMQGQVEAAPSGQSFQAPYPAGFPPIVRTITSMNAREGEAVLDGPPGAILLGDKSDVKLEGEVKASAHDNWVRDKISQLAKKVVVPKTHGQTPIFREPTTDAFVFLVERNSCLLPIGVKIAEGVTPSVEDLWDIRALRRDAEEADWLDENRDWDDCLWVLWDIKETGTAVQALFEKWRQDHNLSPDNVNKLAWCFLSQYTHLRDIELSFQALQSHASPEDSFLRNVEINCDLLEERIRVKDAFTWDIRSSDWDLTALLSNFVADFQLDSPAISSLFIDLKTTILRYRKEWAQQMLAKLSAQGKIDVNALLPASLGLEPQDGLRQPS